jgi:hypothetical protein
MNNIDKERRAIGARLMTALNRLKKVQGMYEACGCRNDVFYPALKAFRENGAFRHVWIPVLSKASQLRKQNLTEDERRYRLLEAFDEALRDWDPKHEITDEELYWLTDVTGRLGIGDMIWDRYLMQSQERDWNAFVANFNEMKRKGAVPEALSVEEYTALLLTIRELDFNRLPYKNPLWLSLGVKTYAEYHKLGFSQVFRMAEWVKTGEVSRVEKALVTAALKAFKRQGKNTRTVVSERLESIEDHDKLSERVGTELDLYGIIDIAHLSPLETVVVEGWRTGELPMPDIRRGYGRAKEFSELKGISPKALHVLEARAMKKLRKVAQMN